jgi:ABC-2 type transport system permease protein
MSSDILSAQEAPRWRDLVAAEWLKFRSLRSTFAILAATTAVAFFLAYGSAKQTASGWPGIGGWMRRDLQPAHDAFFPPGFYAVMIVIGTVGAQCIVSEHASGLIRTTLIAVPRRSRVMLAKAAVLAAALTVVGVLVTAGCWQITLTEYSNRITGYGWTTPATARVFVATVLLFPLVGLLGLAIGTVIRHTAVCIFAMMVAFWVMPVGVSGVDDVLGTHIFGHLADVLPENGWLLLTTTGSMKGIVGGHPSIAEAWISYAAWALAAIAIIILTPRQRDV